MSISSDYLKIIKEIINKVDIPPIKDIVVPQCNSDLKKNNFSAIVLEDDTIGLIFINLKSSIKNKFYKYDFSSFRGMLPKKLVKMFSSNNLFEKSLGLGGINVVSQFLFKNSDFKFNFTSDSLGSLDIKHSDIVGMVGLFPPLVRLIEKRGSKLIIVEKKEGLVQQTKNWSVSLDPEKLRSANKVLITGTTVLNETIDDVLTHCSNARLISIIGPTASFLPDPLFERGISIVGGSYIKNSSSLIDAIKNNRRWGNSVQKYIIEKKTYPGYHDLISKTIK